MFKVKLRVCCTSTTRLSSKPNDEEGAPRFGVRVVARDGGVGGVSSNADGSSSIGVVGTDWHVCIAFGEQGPLRRRRTRILLDRGILEGEDAEAGDKEPSAETIRTWGAGPSGGVTGTAVEEPLEPDFTDGVRGVCDCLFRRRRV